MNIQTGSGTQPALYSKGFFCEEFQKPRHEANHSPPSTSEVKNEWSYASTPPYAFMTLTETTSPFSPLLCCSLGCDIQTEVLRLRIQPPGSLGNDSGHRKYRKFLPIWVTINFSRILLHAAHNVPAIFLKM